MDLNRLKVDKISENRAQVAEFRDLRTKLDAADADLQALEIIAVENKGVQHRLQQEINSSEATVCELKQA